MHLWLLSTRTRYRASGWILKSLGSLDLDQRLYMHKSPHCLKTAQNWILLCEQSERSELSLLLRFVLVHEFSKRLAQCVRWSLIEQTSVVELSTCPMCWVPSEQIFSPNFLDACLTMSANQRRRIQSRNGPGKKLSTLLSFREAAGLTNRSRTTAR